MVTIISARAIEGHFERKNANAAGRSSRGSCSCTKMSRLTGHLQPWSNWPIWASNVLISHRIPRIWPRRTTTCSLDWKKQLKVRHFSSDGEVIAAAETWLDGQPFDFYFLSGLQKLEERAKKGIELRGEYVEQIPSLVGVACFLHGLAKDLPARPRTMFNFAWQTKAYCNSLLLSLGADLTATVPWRHDASYSNPYKYLRVLRFESVWIDLRIPTFRNSFLPSTLKMPVDVGKEILTKCWYIHTALYKTFESRRRKPSSAASDLQYR